MKKSLNKVEKLQRDYFTRTYSGMKNSSKGRGHRAPAFSKQEFIIWCKKEKNWKQLWNDWISAECSTKLRPTIDRLDNKNGYSFENMRIISWDENHHKQTISKSMPVVQIYEHYSQPFIKIHPSITQASQTSKAHKGNILRALKTGGKAGGCRWEYYDKTNPPVVKPSEKEKLEERERKAEEEEKLAIVESLRVMKEYSKMVKRYGKRYPR